jgi:hypothetical protein
LVSPSEAERRELSARLHGLLTVKRDVGNNVPLAVQNDSQSASHTSGDGNNLPSLTAEEASPSASSGLAIPRRPWWRRWFR